MVEDPCASHHYIGFCLVVCDVRHLQKPRPKFKIYMLRRDVITRKDDRHDCCDEPNFIINYKKLIDCITLTHHHQYTPQASKTYDISSFNRIP